MKLPTVTKGLAAIAFLGASTALNAALVLTPGTFGSFGAAVAGPAGFVTSMSSSITDDNGNFSATVVSDVYGVPGAYIFTYTISNDADLWMPGGTGKVVGLQTNADLFAFALRFDPTYIPASLALDQVSGAGNTPNAALYSGSSLFVTFGGAGTSTQIAQGNTSVKIMVTTTAQNYGKGVGSVIDGTSEDAGVFIPLIPEPTTYAGMFALGLAGFAAYRRFRS